MEEHAHSLLVVEQMIRRMGQENSQKVLEALHIIRDAAQDVMKGHNL